MKRPLALLLTAVLGAPALATLPGAVPPITGIRHEYQRLNNCGPVTVGMAMSRWGGTQDQSRIAPRLKPTRTDKNVGPDELAGYARAQGYGVYQGVNGDLPQLKSLLAAGFPIIVETWYVTGEEGGMGHYRLITGYDDARREFSALDSYHGPGVRVDYGALQEAWRGYQGTFLVVYPPDRRARVAAALAQAPTVGIQPRPRQDSGPNMWRAALTQAQAALDNRPGNAVALYNFGAAKLRLGDAPGAARAFGQAEAAAPDLTLDPTRPARVSGGLPWRFLWYRSELLEAYLRVGRNADVLRLTGAVLRDAPDLEEALYWRGRALGALGRAAQARASLHTALRLRPGYAAARAALARLGPGQEKVNRSGLGGWTPLRSLPLDSLPLDWHS